ncbi:MAG: hypothetical protein HY898_23505 [Deltaproteobacteria bacterium]|nr:hypothetical protein [Deltaproteobacteria bacterium]
MRTVLRVSSQTFEHGTLTKDENRYLLCSLSSDRFSPEQWLKLVRQYWMVSAMARRGQKQALGGPLTDPLDPPASDEAPAESMAGRVDAGLIRACRPPRGLRSR